MASLKERFTRWKGKAAKEISHAAGDRRSEAKNRVEAATGQKPEEPVVDAVEHETRRRHHDLPE